MNNRKVKARLAVLPWIWRHPANRNARLRAVARGAIFQLRGRLFRAASKTTVGKNAYLFASVGSPAASKAVYANPPDWPEMQAWKLRLRSGDLFLDIGANVGVYSLWAADCGASVLAVEPGPSAGTLRRNVASNRLPIEVIEAAACEIVGSAAFDSTGDTRGHIASSGVRVRATTVDALLGERSAAGMKIDVEGAEHLVLLGASRALEERRIACIQLEWNSASESSYGVQRSTLADFLAGKGYQLFRPNCNGILEVLDDTRPGADVFALPAQAM